MYMYQIKTRAIFSHETKIILNFVRKESLIQNLGMNCPIFVQIQQIFSPNVIDCKGFFRGQQYSLIKTCK